MKELYKNELQIRVELGQLETNSNQLNSFYKKCQELKLWKSITPELFHSLILNGEDLVKSTVADKLNKESKISVFGFSFKKSNVLNLIESKEVEDFIAYYNRNIKGKGYELALDSLELIDGEFTVKEKAKAEIIAKQTVTVDGVQEKALRCYESIITNLNLLRAYKNYHDPSSQMSELMQTLDFDIERKKFTLNKKGFQHWRA